MKKVFILLFMLACAFAQAKPIRVVTTIPDLADFARQVGGGRVEVSTLASGAENTHNVMMTPSMVTRIAKADLFILMGLNLEHSYAPALLQESRNPKVQYGRPGYLDTSRGVKVREVPLSLDRSEGDVHPAGNPHYNLDPEYAKMIIQTIADRLSELDPAGRVEFQANAKRSIVELDRKIREWKSKLAGRRVKFIAYHPHWVYFCERFGCEQEATIEPKPGVEPGPRHIEQVIEKMKADGVKLIVKESFYSDRLPREIAEKTGARVVSVPIMVGGVPEADTYVKMMDRVVDSFAGKP